jgi:hypothetical protein
MATKSNDRGGMGREAIRHSAPKRSVAAKPKRGDPAKLLPADLRFGGNAMSRGARRPPMKRYIVG